MTACSSPSWFWVAIVLGAPLAVAVLALAVAKALQMVERR